MSGAWNGDPPYTSRLAKPSMMKRRARPWSHNNLGVTTPG
jgi:hypothetical protein